MKQNVDGIQRLLKTLAKHADLVAEAFSGPVSGGDRERDDALQELVEAGALKPFEEDAYYLTGGLHDYFSMSLASFHAFQTLTRVDGLLRQAKQQWKELQDLKRAGAMRDMERLELALRRSIIDIADVVERNIHLLNTMVNGQYGNVDSLASKLRQNLFYANEVEHCFKELLKVDSFGEQLSGDALAAGLPHVRQLANSRLRGNQLNWSARLKDAQAVISRRLFDARLMETRLRQLARYSSWLNANRSVSGWEVEIGEDVDVALARAVPLTVRPQPDTRDPSSENVDKLVEIAAKLPAPKVISPAPIEHAADNVVIATEMEEVYLDVAPHERALARLVARLAAGEGPISLRDWQSQCEELRDVPTEHWVLYSAVQLRAGKHSLRFIGEPTLDPMSINETFYDAEVLPKAASVED